MDLHYQKEITVGTLVLVGIGLFVAGTMWLKGATFRPPPGPRRSRSPTSAPAAGQRGDHLGLRGRQGEGIKFKGPGRVLVTITLPPDLDAQGRRLRRDRLQPLLQRPRLALNPGTAGNGPLPEGQQIRG